MPRFDGTGPRGLGSKTGRGQGRCQKGGTEAQNPGFGQGRGAGQGRGQGLGQGQGQGFGKGLGNGFGYSQNLDSQSKLEELKAYKARLESEIADLEKQTK